MIPAAQTGAGNVTSATVGAGTGVTVGKPSNTTNGDLLVCLVTNSLTSSTWTAPSGWTQLGGGNASRSMYLYSKPIPSAAAETATDYTWNFSGGSGRGLVICARITGADLTYPLDVAGAVQTTGTSSCVAASVTTQFTNTLLLAGWFSISNTTTLADITGPGSMTDVAEVNVVTTANQDSLLTQELIPAAGATGTRTATISPSASSGVGGFLVGIRAQQSGSPAFTGSGALTFSEVPGPAETLATSGSGTLTLAGTPELTSAEPLSGSGALSGTGTIDVPGSFGLSGAGSLGFAASPAVPGSVDLSGDGQVDGAPVPGYIGAAELSGSGVLGLVGIIGYTGAVALSGNSDLFVEGPTIASGTLDRTGSGTTALDGSGGYDGAFGSIGTGTQTRSGTPRPTYGMGLSGDSIVAYSGRPKPSQSLPLAGAGTLALAGSFVGVGTLALTGAGTLTLDAIPGYSRTLEFSGSGDLQVVKFAAIDIDAKKPLTVWRAEPPDPTWTAGPLSLRSP